ncbi:hypothetical protein [Methylobacterium sp. Leaf88]|nr:hypothetical protein [Methylobacterium sp. Leaf88]
MQIDQADRMQDLEHKNARVRRLLADLSWEDQALVGVALGNF